MKNQVHPTKRILDALEKAVAELPLEDMIADTQLANGASPRSFDTMTENAHDIVRLLAIDACLGDVNAVRDLRHLGMLVTEILMSLANIGKENSESKGDGIYRLRDHLTTFYGYDGPILTIDGDFSEVKNILERESESISKLPLESIRGWVDSHASMDTTNQMTISAPGLLSPEITIKSNITSAPSDYAIEIKSFHQKRFEKMDLMVGSRKMSQDFYGSLTTSKEAIHEIILRMMASRLSDYVQNNAGPTVSRVASESPTWPVLASALEYAQPELESLLDSMGFGTNLPFRIRRMGKSGAPRSFKPGTQAAFALAVCLDIESTRKAYQHSTKEELDALRMEVSQIERDRANRPPYKLGPPNPDNGGQRMVFRDRLWAVKAALLPPFPLNSEKSSASKNSFEEWHKVAMLRAETLCFSDWENYPWWPSCVMNRAGWDETAKRHRTVFEAVSEKLRAGMKKLQPDTSGSLRP